MTKRQKEIVARLPGLGMRITKQRLGLVELLWGVEGDQHISAEKLFTQARRAGLDLSLATVYNTLNQWADKGLLKRVQPNQQNLNHRSGGGSGGGSGGRGGVYFDTNISSHYHFFDESENNLIDIEQDNIVFESMPKPPRGKKISGVDVFIRINKNPLD